MQVYNTGVLVAPGGRWEGVAGYHGSVGVLSVPDGHLRLDAGKLRLHSAT